MNWMHGVAALPLWLTTGIVFFLSGAVPWLLVRLVRRRWPYPAFKENNELVGFTYAVYGLIYGVLLAFTIIVAWERFAEAERIMTREVTVLSQLWRDVQSFPPEVHREIHRDLMDYAQSVADDEWPALGTGQPDHPKTKAIYERLWARTYTLNPGNANQEAYLAEFLARMNELSGTRRTRVLHGQTEVHVILWLVLFVGAIPAVGYPFLFASRHGWVQAVIAGTVMLIVLLGLLVVLYLQYPFASSVGLEPTPFRELLDAFRGRLAAAGAEG